jgi:hypothetical protein
MDEKIFDQGIRLALERGIRLKIELEGVDIPLESSFCELHHYHPAFALSPDST